MLFPDRGFKAGFSVPGVGMMMRAASKPIATMAATARAARVRRTLRTSGEQRWSRAANSAVPERKQQMRPAPFRQALKAKARSRALRLAVLALFPRGAL